MAAPVRDQALRTCARGLAWVVLLATGVCSAGCSFDLSSLTPGSSKDAAPQVSPLPAGSPSEASDTNPADALLHIARAQALAQSGKSAEARAEFSTALNLDPHNAQAFYQRGIMYQSEKQYEFAIADFTSANGLTPLQADPLLSRAQCYLALGKNQEAAADLDEAVQAAPQNGQIWLARGTAYERIGDRTKAAESYSRAVTLRPKDEAARSGLARTGGRAG
jgi:tetratricopeptide (TPR) repeat protein